MKEGNLGKLNPSFSSVKTKRIKRAEDLNLKKV